MATTVSEVISQALIFINDIRLTEMLRSNPARFYRKMSAYVQIAMPVLNRPPALFKYVQSEYVPATYDSVSWTSTAESTESSLVIPTGRTGYELCSVARRSEDGTFETPYTDFIYDPETGNITVAQQEAVGINYEVDFYKDGSFADLTYTMMRLFALAVATVWYDNFSNDWLNMQMKIHDSNFDTVNESNYIEKTTAKGKEMKQQLSAELHKYEQDVAYSLKMPKPFQVKSKALI